MYITYDRTDRTAPSVVEACPLNVTCQSDCLLYYVCVLSGSQDQVQKLTARLQQEQSEKAYLKSQNEHLEKELADTKKILGNQLAEKDATIKRLEEEVNSVCVCVCV